MSRLFHFVTALVPLATLWGCGPVVQDLGGEPTPSKAVPTGFDHYDPHAIPVPNPTPATDVYCPAARPLDDSACAMVEAQLCPYRGGAGCTDTCICGVDGHWVCLQTGCTAFTTSACTEGAPCEEGSSCELVSVRTCQCLSSGRLHCTDAVPR
jgi:hypothetical protein